MSAILPTTSALSGAPQASQREQLHAAAKQFEAIFVRQMLSAARKTDFGGDMFGGQAMQTFRQLQDEHFADIASETGALGLASIIEAQMARFLPAEASPAAAGEAVPAATEKEA